MFRFTKLRTVILSVFLFSFLLVSCVTTDPFVIDATKEKVLNCFTLQKVTSFNPLYMYFPETYAVSSQIMEALYQYKYLSDSYEVEPLVAEALPKVSADGLTYTITLRKDAYYYDPEKKVFPNGTGRPVSSEDFAFSLNRIIKPEFQSPGYDFFKIIKEVRTPDSQTLIIKLHKQFPQLVDLLTLALSYPIPSEMVSFYGDSWPLYVIGSGPYYYDSSVSTKDKRYILRKNPSWHGGKFPKASEIGKKAKALGIGKDAGKALPFVDVISFTVEATKEKALEGFLSGKYDTAYITTNRYDLLKDEKLTPALLEKGYTLSLNSYLDLTFDFFNMNDALWGSANPKGKYLRQAVQCAIPLEGLRKLYYGSPVLQAETIIPPGLEGWNPDFKNPYTGNNLEKGKALLVKAGYTLKTIDGKVQALGKDGKQLTLVQHCSGVDEINHAWGNFYSESLEQIGIKVENIYLTWPSFLQKLEEKKFTFAGYGWGADYADAQNFLGLFYAQKNETSYNYSGYNNSEYNALYEKAQALQSLDERAKIYAKLAQILVEDAPLLTKTHRVMYQVKQAWLKNYVFQDKAFGSLKYLDIDLDKKNIVLNSTSN